jgi:hypothetical protein
MIHHWMGTGARKHLDGAAAVEPAITVPAPPSPRPAGQDDEARTTTVPGFDLETLAAASSWETRLPQQTRAQLPLDLSIPVRRRASVDGVPLRAAFLLSHVDNHMSITDIAATAQLPVADVIESFILLADLGVVELRGAGGRPSAPSLPAEPEKQPPPRARSGLRPKT